METKIWTLVIELMIVKNAEP